MCWSNHQVSRGAWSRDMRRRDSVRRDTVRGDVVRRRDLRVSDAERDQVVAQLSRHTADGRLSLEEFEQRVEHALAAKTRGDLDATLGGLPLPSPRAARRPRIDLWAPMRLVAMLALVALAIVTLGAWVLWIVVPVAWCRLNRGSRRRWRHEVERSGPEADELTLV